MDRGDDRKKSKPTSTKKKNEGEVSDEDYDPEMENLNAIEKEQLYLERLERKEKEKRKQELEKEAKASKGAQKKELLSELQSKRQNAKDKKERMIAEENRDDSDENDSESEGEINSKRKKKRDADEDFVVDDDKDMRGSRPEKKRKKSPSQEKRASEKSQTLTMEVLEKIRLSRKSLALLCSHTIFEKTVKGAFVRVNQSSSAKASAHDYVIAEIVGIKDYTKYYPVDDKETNKILMLKHGGKERPMKICFVSNGEFTGGEFTKWINKMQREGQKIPTVGDIERKKSEIDQGLNYRYSESEIRQNIDQRIQEKLRKGDALTYHEIEILENKKIQKEREYLMVVKRDEGAKKEIERLDESIKKAKSLLREQRTSKPLKKEEDRNVLNEMDEMFKDDEEENKEPERNNRNHKAHEREERGREVIEEDEDDKLENEKMVEEMKKRGVTMTEMYDEMKKEFIKAHKVDLSIDKMIDEWEIEGEAAAS